MGRRDDLIRHYRWLRRYGINDSHSGNVSVRHDRRIWITPTGACADTLTADDLVRMDLEGEIPAGASLDAPLHRAVYGARPDAGAVIHSHGPYTVALTMAGDDLQPADFEGRLYFPTVPVLSIDFDHYTQESPGRVAAALHDHPIVVVRGHGVYACAPDLNLAYKWTCSLEHSAKTAFIARLAGGPEAPAHT